jgi:RimJ/RimL family protein N-acetyltransferase/dTDP-4-dehydrorhamnose 3,5-epimerase-like enzyme
MPNASLRLLNEKDAPFMLEWMLDDSINCYYRFNPDKVSQDSVLQFIRDSQIQEADYHFAIVAGKAESDEYLGTVSLKNVDSIAGNAEYAIALRTKAMGEGYGYSATKQILEYAFEKLSLQRVYLSVLSGNTQAISFYEKVGFVYEGEFASHVLVRNELCSLKWFRLLKSEFAQVHKRQMRTVDDVKELEFPQLGDDRGNLVVVEGGQNIPFEIKRIFYIYGSDADVVRGQHANKRSSFCLINMSGQSKVKVTDIFGGEKIFVLDRPHIGLYLPTMIWKDMYEFSEDSVLLVASDEQYDGSEYIRDYDEYLKRGKLSD